MKRKYPVIKVSECRHFNIFTMSIGARYCEKCNFVILFFPHYKKDFREIEENIVDILNHETLHWILLKEISEDACLALDAIATCGEEKKREGVNLWKQTQQKNLR